MTYGIIGVGAVGAYFGGRLAQSGHDVHFLLHNDFDFVRQNGLFVDSYMGDFHLQNLNIYNDVSSMPLCDVVLVCLKTTYNHLLSSLLPPLLKPSTVVILVQNGIGVEADVQKLFPQQPIAAGVAFINAAKIAPGRILHNNFGHITICNYSCTDLTVLQQVVDHFKTSQVKSRIADYNETRWTKNILNMATNGVTVLLDARCDQLIADPASCLLVRGLMIEGIHAAQACGVSAIHEDLADKLIENSRNTQFATSMKFDYDHHQPLEIKYLYSRPIEEAERLGCNLPKLRMLEQQLLFLNQRSGR